MKGHLITLETDSHFFFTQNVRLSLSQCALDLMLLLNDFFLVPT